MPYRIMHFLWPVGAPLLALLVAVLFILSAAPGQAVSGNLQAGVVAPAEAWRVGVTSEGNAGYTTVIGRLVDTSTSFRSNRGVQDIYYIFPAPASTRTIKSTDLKIISRSGTYTSTASLALEVRDASGSLQHIVSAASIDLQVAATDSWTGLDLATDPTRLTIMPGEHLVAHFTLADAPAGTLDVRLMFEVIVQ